MTFFLTRVSISIQNVSWVALIEKADFVSEKRTWELRARRVAGAGALLAHTWCPWRGSARQADRAPSRIFARCRPACRGPGWLRPYPGYLIIFWLLPPTRSAPAGTPPCVRTFFCREKGKGHICFPNSHHLNTCDGGTITTQLALMQAQRGQGGLCARSAALTNASGTPGSLYAHRRILGHFLLRFTHWVLCTATSIDSTQHLSNTRELE